MTYKIKLSDEQLKTLLDIDWDTKLSYRGTDFNLSEKQAGVILFIASSIRGTKSVAKRKLDPLYKEKMIALSKIGGEVMRKRFAKDKKD